MRSRLLPVLIAGASLALAVSACVQGATSDKAGGPSVASSPASSGTGPASTPPIQSPPHAAASTSGATSATASPLGVPATPTTTETAWGRIWDALPGAFPVYPGAKPSDTGEGPASAVVDLPATAAKAEAWYGAALVKAGYTIDALGGPLEDGSTVIDAVGQHPTCRIQASIVPHGARSIATILMAADCPFH